MRKKKLVLRLKKLVKCHTLFSKLVAIDKNTQKRDFFLEKKLFIQFSYYGNCMTRIF